MNDGIQGIGLLGCGAIGRGLAMTVDEGKVCGAALVALFDQDSSTAQDLGRELNSNLRIADSFESFMATEGLTLVVEAALRRPSVSTVLQLFPRANT